MTQPLIEELGEVIKSPKDPRSFRTLKLPNGLSVVCVQIPHSKKASASLAVRAGHFNDPLETQGLAHFLEHMLFLGNERFPDANEFPEFLSAYGGQQNAWTGSEFCNFFFDCQTRALSRALDYFSAMFMAPLFDESLINKERQSIDSEFRLKEKDELRRLYQVHKTTCNPEHPFSKFSVGNMDTLAESDSHSLKDQLSEFFRAFFNANNMRLTIVGAQPVDELAEMAQHYFSDISSGQENDPKSLEALPLYLPSQLGVFIQVKPVNPARRLIITLPLPGIDDDYKNKTTSFIAHILGYEGPHSLYATLRARGWVNSLSAGGGMSGSGYKDFNLNIQLTEAGVVHALQVAQAVFNYIQLIASSGLEAWRYEEKRLTSELSFHFQETPPAGELAPQLSVNAHHYPIHDVVYGDYRMDGLSVARAKQTLSLMAPERARITLIHGDVETDQQTELYHTPFSIRALTKEELNTLNSPAGTFSYQLPAQNPYITSHVEPYPLERELREPVALIKSDNVTIWHLQDPDFRVPKGHIYLNLESPAVNQSATHFAAARLWSELLIDSLNEALYDAEVAGLHFNIYPTQSGMTIHTMGLSAGQLPLLQQLMKQAWKVKFKRGRFNSVAQQLKHNWQSAHNNQPLNRLFAELNLTLQPCLFSLSDMAEGLNSLDYKGFSQLSSELFNSMGGSALIHGDWQAKTAFELHQLIRDSASGRLTASPPQLQPKRLEPHTHIHRTVEQATGDNAVLVYFQGDNDSAEQQITWMLAQQLLNASLFDELRTQRQLGYVVGSQYFPVRRLPGFMVFVQSPTHNTSALQEHIHTVLHDKIEQLDNVLTLQRWKHAKQTLSEQLTINDRSLRARSQRFWGAIQMAETHFDRNVEMSAALERLQLSDWISEVKRLVIKQPRKIVLLSCQ